MAVHDTECPNWDKVSLNNTNIDMYNDKISSPEELGKVVEHKQTLGEFMVCNNHNNLTGLGLTFRDCQNKDHFVPVPVLYYDSTTCVGNVFSRTSYDCQVLMTMVICAGKNQVSFPSLVVEFFSHHSLF